ncbi:MAG: hypothetical protein ABIS36_22970 [Chryseolinea sp.]
MMSNHIFNVVILMFIGSLAYAQNDSIRAEILRFEGTKAELIQRGRGVLMEKIERGEKSNVEAIFKYLLGEEDHYHVAFHPIEKYLLYYYLNDFSSILNQATLRSSEVSRERFYAQMRPASDLLAYKLVDIVRFDRNEIIQSIKNSNLSSSDKSFLKLNLNYLSADFGVDHAVQDSLNVAANQYLTAHPGNEFEKYIRTDIRYEFKPSKWGVGVEFFTGYSLFTDNLSKRFYNTVAVGVAFDICYKNWTLFVRDYIGSSRIKDSIAFSNVTWQRHSKATLYLPEISVGYVTYENKFVIVTPFLGMSWASFSPTDNDKDKIPEYKNIGLSFTKTYTLGTNVDFKLGRSMTNKLKGSESTYWFVRVRYAYNIGNFENQYTGFNGNIHSLTIGVGGFSRQVKRVY